jgi:hypothetical protein
MVMSITSTSPYERACRRACAQAKRSGQELFVVYEGDGEYAVATEEDLDTWWLGATVHAAYSADGTRID